MQRVSGKHDTDRSLSRLGEVIRSRRKQAGWSQETFADQTGIDRSHMGKIERGERNVTFLNLQRIASALGCALSELLLEAGL